MFQRYFDDGLAQASFLIGCRTSGDAFVIDPRRDIGIYVDAARSRNLRIACAIETHIHADFVSGSCELAALGARTIAGPGSSLQFDSYEVSDGERLRIGDITLRFLHTPGHTPEHVSILVEQPGEPVRAFTGDTLFVGAVGRPDLLGEELTRRLAGELYDSLFGKLLALDDSIEVHPGHGSGSLCGAGIGAAPHSTIGQERLANPMLKHTSRDAFVSAVLADLPETPAYFSRMKRINRQGPAVLGLANGYPALPPLSPIEVDARLHEDVWLIDLHQAEEFGAGHPSGAINIPSGSRIGYWAGWLLPGNARTVLLASSESHLNAALPQLLRVGLDRVEGFLDGGVDAWRRTGLPVSRVRQMPARDLHGRLARHEPLAVLDVRTPREWSAGHIDGAINVPIGDLPGRIGALPHGAPVATLCEGGYRSAIAASLLARAGRHEVINITGGMTAYRELSELC